MLASNILVPSMSDVLGVLSSAFAPPVVTSRDLSATVEKDASRKDDACEAPSDGDTEGKASWGATIGWNSPCRTPLSWL